MSFSFRAVPAGGKRKPEEPSGVWPRTYKALSVGALCSELMRLASEPPRYDYDKRRRFILQELDLRTDRSGG